MMTVFTIVNTYVIHYVVKFINNSYNVQVVLKCQAYQLGTYLINTPVR